MSNISKRKSGIELLKIFAILLVVLSHVTQTLFDDNSFISYSDYIIDVSQASLSIRNFVIAVLAHSGQLGNWIFFISSAWFMLDSKKNSKQKLLCMLADIWVISIIVLACALAATGFGISFKIIIKSLFPSTFANNWYLTCYMLFYAVYPMLNSAIERLSRVQLLRTAVIMLVLYEGIVFVKSDLLFNSTLIVWACGYFAVAYIKKYGMDFVNSKSKNIILLVGSILGFLAVMAITNALGLKIGFFANKMLRWNTSNNPFLLSIALSLFNIAYQSNLKNKAVNYISGLSMLVYIIHENIIIRTYVRPYIWNSIYQNIGYKYLWFIIAVFTLLLAAISAVLAIIYKATLGIAVKKLCTVCYASGQKLWAKAERKIIK